jgi:hypothetical protein
VPHLQDLADEQAHDRAHHGADDGGGQPRRTSVEPDRRVTLDGESPATPVQNGDGGPCRPA